MMMMGWTLGGGGEPDQEKGQGKDQGQGKEKIEP
jgi:hypothetical protein